MNMLHFKDEILNSLARHANVAQFISFGPGVLPTQRFSRIFGFPENHTFPTLDEAVEALLRSSPERSINVRSFLPGQPQGHEFIYGIQEGSAAVGHIRRLAKKSLYTIINETIDVHDGGVSGVCQGGIVEFSPGEVPRFIEKNSQDPIPALPFSLAMRLLEIVYGFTPSLHYDLGSRVEFSIHPQKRGWHNQQTIVWEEESVQQVSFLPYYVWPNAFSKLLGDKTYGLLIAFLLDAPVPATTVFPRNRKIPPFSFGVSTTSDLVWTRTCPAVPVPGKYLTVQQELAPFAVMESEDPTNSILASCLLQKNIPAHYSGTVLTDTQGGLVIEGVAGSGENYMLGKDSPVSLPPPIQQDLTQLHSVFAPLEHPVYFEWVHDGIKPWIVQLHLGAVQSKNRVIYPGTAEQYTRFNIALGLEALRTVIEQSKKTDSGIIIVGNVGLGSHVADILRKAKIPSYIETPH